MQTKTKAVSKSVKSVSTVKKRAIKAKATNPTQAAITIHPSTANFPDLPVAEFEALKEDIRAHGQQQPILLKDSQIVDGRQRYRVCIELGIKPEFIEIGANISPEQAMVSNNLLRRHLNESQRAMIGASLVTTRLGSNQNTRETVSQLDAATLLGVSTDSIQRAAKLMATGNRGLMKVVGSGRLTVHEAVQLTRLPPKQLKTVVAAANDEDFRHTVKLARNNLREIKLSGVREGIEEKRANNQPIDSVAGQFGVLYIDPPWDYLSETDIGYPTMSREQLLNLDVGSKADENAACFMWVPASQLPLALELMQAWGFEYKTHAVWDKEAPGTGSYFHSRHELLLLGTRGILPEVEPKCRHQSIFAEKRTQHSRKPKAAQVIIEQMYPTLTKLELFCRGKARDGWKVWGNEAIPAEQVTKPPVVKATKARSTLRREGVNVVASSKAANQRRFRKAA